MTEFEKKEVAMFGVTVVGMREAVKQRLARRYHTPTDMAISLIANAQEELNFNVEDARQTLNRAKWILMEYATEDSK